MVPTNPISCDGWTCRKFLNMRNSSLSATPCGPASTASRSSRCQAFHQRNKRASSASFLSFLHRAMISSGERDQRRLGATVVFPAREQGMRSWKQLQCTLAASFLVAPAKLMKFLPRRRFDDGYRNFEQLDRRFKGATTSTEF